MATVPSQKRSPQYAVEADQLTLAPGGKVLLDGFSLAVRPGETVGIQAPSGRGKTKLLRALALLDLPAVGQVRLFGEAPTGRQVPAARSRAVYLHQRPVLLDATVRTNLTLPYRYGRRRHQSPDWGWIDGWLDEIGRGESFLQRTATDLSGGEQQWVALLRACATDAELLLLDEPTGSMDEDHERIAEACIRTWQRSESAPRSFVLVSHRSDQLQRLCDRTVSLPQGTRTDG